MRNIFTLLFLLFIVFHTEAQIEIVPLESNPVLQRTSAQEEALRNERFANRPGTATSATNRDVPDCDNVDGLYYSGETIYLISGDSIELCFNISDLDTLNDTSFDLGFGTTELAGDCITYFSDIGVTLGLTDTIRAEKCDSLGCQSFYYPIVVKRAGMVFNQPLQVLTQEQEIEICTPPVELPGAISTTELIDCGDEMLGEVYNVNFQDNCFDYVASRFAEIDSVCFEICDEYCICDTYTFAFSTAVVAISYPFMDDFSYAGPHPAKRKWLDDNVFINSTMAYQSPSVGVATFDGLDETGTPYGSGKGRCDFLTSNYFDLNSGDTDLWLSFWLENKGLAYPSNPGDSMIIEFKNDIGTWIQMMTIDGFDYNSGDRPPFEFYKIPLDDSDNNYLHNSFQFRFVNEGNRSNMQDTWHLDYVVLDKGEPDSTFQDMAFGRLPSDILGRYSSMPWWQFDGFAEAELADSTAYSLINHFTVAAQAANESFVNHRELMTNTNLNIQFTVNEPPTPIDPGQRLDALRAVPSVSDLANSLEGNFPGLDKVVVERSYTLVPNIGQAGLEDVLRNDTVRAKTFFDNYYAYDDGTAEIAGGVNQGHEVMMRFSTNVEDELRAVQFHFPRYGNQSSSALFNIKVYVGTLESEPVYERNFIKPFYVDSVLDSLQGFTTYRLIDLAGEDTPVQLPVGDFYVGWEQSSSADNKVFVGMDLNTNNSEHLFYNDNVNWYNLTNADYAFMVRPVVGSVTPGETPVEEVSQLSDWMHIYPNPASDQLYFDIKSGDASDYQVKIYTTTGQLVLSEALDSRAMDISQFSQGMYFVEVLQRSSNVRLTHKLVVR